MSKYVRCSNPTCSTRLMVSTEATDDVVRRVLAINNWTLFPDPGLDDKPMPYCPRCT